MAFYDFADRLEVSRGRRCESDILTIEKMVSGCTWVQKSSEEVDRMGIDYVAYLRGGAEVFIDAKTRTPGCSRYWKQGPELALEIWSVIPESGRPGKTGWTLSEKSLVDYILFTFDPKDTDAAFLYPFQLLRTTFRRNLPQWWKSYKIDVQSSGSWRSQCIFVPEIVVWDALRQVVVSSECPQDAQHATNGNNKVFA